MFHMIKEPEQIIAAAEVLKIAEKLRHEKWEKDRTAIPPPQPAVWNEHNTPLDFVEQAYHSLRAVAAKIQAVESKEDAEASMRMIDAIASKPTA